VYCKNVRVSFVIASAVSVFFKVEFSQSSGGRSVGIVRSQTKGSSLSCGA
jgi:hypothetical protein